MSVEELIDFGVEVDVCLIIYVFIWMLDFPCQVDKVILHFLEYFWGSELAAWGEKWN